MHVATSEFLAGGGIMGALIRSHDWGATPLGPPEQWPQSLRTVVRLVLNTRHAMYIWWGPELTCLYNDAYSACIGPERHPASLGRPGREVWAEIWDIIGPQIEQVMAGRGATWHENHLVPITRNGVREDVYWTYSYSPIDDGASPDQVGGVLVVCNETTASVELAQRRQDELARQRQVFQQAPGFVIVMRGEDHQVEFVNDAHERTFGSSDWHGRPIRDAFPDIEGQGFFELLDGVYRTGVAHVATAAPATFRPPGASVPQHRLLDFIYAPVLEADGTVSGIFCEGFDVTERQQVQEALRASEEQLRLAVEAADVGLWDVDLVVGTLYWPARVKAMFGISAERAVSMDDFYAGLHPEDRDATTVSFAAACDPAQRALYDVEYRTIGSEDGRLRWVAAKGRGVFDPQGRCIRVIGTAIDISARKAAEAALRASEEKLRESDRRKTEFLAMLGHELRNPLAPIASASALLMRAYDHHDVVLQAGEVICRQVSHMTELVDDLLDVSRVTQGLIAIEKVPVDLKELVHSALEQTRPLMEAHAHTVSLRLPPAAVWVLGDATRLVQTLANLLSNAAKYTPDAGFVTVTLDTINATATARLSVRDTGNGIEGALLPHVFDLFVQAERTPDRSLGGLGVGLALVKALVDLHGGRIEVASSGKGQGSEFTLHLPVVSAPPKPVGRQEQDMKLAKPSRILLTDDNIDAAETLAALLQLDGHEVVVCHAATAALAQAKESEFDAYLLDIGLPDMTGLELARSLRQLSSQRNAVYIAVTGYGLKADREAATVAGFDHHLIKPVDFEALRQLLTRPVVN